MEASKMAESNRQDFEIRSSLEIDLHNISIDPSVNIQEILSRFSETAAINNIPVAETHKVKNHRLINRLLSKVWTRATRVASVAYSFIENSNLISSRMEETKVRYERHCCVNGFTTHGQFIT